MKQFLPIAAGLLLAGSLSAQKTETKLDERFQPAKGAYRYVQYTELVNGIYQHEIKLYPENKLFAKLSSKDAKGDQAEGEYTVYHPNGLTVKSKGMYADGKPNGEYQSFYNDGRLEEKAVYQDGKLKGTAIKYYRNGAVSDSIVGDGNGNKKLFQFFENGNRIMEGQMVSDSVKSGSWNFYSEEGQLIGTEKFENGKSVSAVCVDANGTPLKTECKTEEADFVGGNEAWRAFLTAFLNPEVPVKNGAPAGTYTVMLQFVVEKDGRLSDIRTRTGFGYGMEAEAIRVLRRSPRWQPSVLFGHNVRAYRRQPITFQIVEEKKKRK